MTRAEAAARKYVEMWTRLDLDRDARRALLDACWAADGRIVARGMTIRGREAVWASMEGFFANLNGRKNRLTSEIDANDNSFRFRAALDNPDGASLEVHDIGEIDADGRIVVIYTFNGPLKDAGAGATG
jgi:hypothetical protein